MDNKKVAAELVKIAKILASDREHPGSSIVFDAHSQIGYNICKNENGDSPEDNGEWWISVEDDIKEKFKPNEGAKAVKKFMELVYKAPALRAGYYKFSFEDNSVKCDLCNKRLGDVYYDGKTVHGPWATMCENCFKEDGVGLGTGRGQMYKLINGK